MKVRKLNKETGKSRFSSEKNAIRNIQSFLKEKGTDKTAEKIREDLVNFGKVETKTAIYVSVQNRAKDSYKKAAESVQS